jgi:CO/xanthine dehydrogenase Mo-binding subunit
MLHAKFLRSPYANAVVKNVDVAAAKRIPGVVDILTWEDDEVAVIVVAETEELCDEALKALNPQWEVRPHIVDILEGRKPDAPVIQENPDGMGNITIATNNRGDVEAGFREADQIIEYDFNMNQRFSRLKVGFKTTA